MLRLRAGVLSAALFLSGIAPSAQTTASPEGRAVATILRRNVLDPARLPGSNNKAAYSARYGRWTVDKAAPPGCPSCFVVHYTDSRTDFRGTWTVDQRVDGPVIVAEDANAAVAWVRRLTRREADSMLLTAHDAVYPTKALTVHRAGSVIVQMSIDMDGRVTRSRIVTGDPLLEAAAIEAADSMTFRPFRVGATPVRSIALLRVDFTAGAGEHLNSGRTSKTFLDRY